MELLREELSRITGSTHCLDIKEQCRRAACLTAVYSMPDPAAAEADSSAFFTKFILEQLEEMSRKLDRQEESLQKEGRWPRRRRRRGHVRCHRCQQPGHIARHFRAPAPVTAGRRQTSVVASSAPEYDAWDSAVPTAALELDKRSYRVDRKGVLSLTDTSSDVAAVSQASSKPRGQRRRSRQKTTSPQSADEMPDPEDPETGCVTVSCHRPTNTVLRVLPVKSCLRQSIAAPAVRDASEHELPCCVSSEGVRKFDLSPPKFVRHRVFYIYNTGRPVPP